MSFRHAAEAVAEQVADFDSAVVGRETQSTRWTGCSQGSAVELWRMQGTGHVPGFNTNFRDELIESLLSFQRP